MTVNRLFRHFTRAFIPAYLIILLAACGGQPSDTPTITPAATAPTASEPSGNSPTPGPAADGWATVRERGQLIVGTSADYPPFAFYTDEFELDGYDVALARLIGERIGVPVEFKDMAFDGLGGALQVGQIDAAIAAISVTDQRRDVADFSNIYYVSEDAALARADAGIIIRTPADLAPYRVGVQDGSVFQTRLNEAAVSTGLMPAENLLAYTQTEQAIADLRDGRVDVVVADRLPLELVAQDDAELAIAGRGLNSESYAVALAGGSTLIGPINEALAALDADGSLADLADRYLGLETAELLPLPTPEPTPEGGEPPARAALPASGCIDAMALVEHVTYDDDNMRTPPPVAPGESFQKVWRLRNTGTCTWDNRYLVTPVGGNNPQARMGGQATPIQGTVAPGQEVNVAVDLVAPLVPGVYQGFWSMRGPGGLLFGDRLWVGVTVTEAPTPTPPPTAAPSAGISFTANTTTILAGQCVTFSWVVTNAASVYFSAQGQPWQLNEVSSSGSQSECPNTSTTYDLRVIGSNGTVDIRSIRIQVTPAPNAPFIVFFTVTPSFQITFGQCVDVRWQVDGEVSNVRVTRNDLILWDGAPLNGTSRDCPPVGEAVYAVVAGGPGGEARGQQNVTVLPQPTPPPQASVTPIPTATPPPGGQPPVINSFSVNPVQIAPGQCVTVAWSVGGTVSRVQILRDGIVVLDFALLSGSVNDCLNVPGVFTYRVQAIAPDGRTAFQQAAVTVGSGQTGGIVGGWRLVNINGAVVIPGTEITAVFGDGSNLSGQSGCNTYTAAYQTNGTSLSVGSLNVSQQTCNSPAGVMDQEQLYLQVLASASGFTVEGRQLTIRSARGQLAFENMQGP